MQPDIEAIFLDVGNTLRIVVEDPAFQQQAKEELMRLIDSKESPEVFFEKVEGRWKNYRSLSKKSLLEASELELWTQWLLPDYPVEVVAPHISRLTRTVTAGVYPALTPRKPSSNCTGADTCLASSPTRLPRPRSPIG